MFNIKKEKIMLTRNDKKTTQVAEREEKKYEIINWVNLKVVSEPMDMSEASEFWNNMLSYYWEHSCCLHQKRILYKSFPFFIKEAGQPEKRPAPKQVTKDWATWWKINKKFWDTLHDEEDADELHYDDFEELSWDYADRYGDVEYLYRHELGEIEYHGTPIDPNEEMLNS